MKKTAIFLLMALCMLFVFVFAACGEPMTPEAFFEAMNNVENPNYTLSYDFEQSSAEDTDTVTLAISFELKFDGDKIYVKGITTIIGAGDEDGATTFEAYFDGENLYTKEDEGNWTLTTDLDISNIVSGPQDDINGLALEDCTVAGNVLTVNSDKLPAGVAAMEITLGVNSAEIAFTSTDLDTDEPVTVYIKNIGSTTVNAPSGLPAAN